MDKGGGMFFFGVSEILELDTRFLHMSLFFCNILGLDILRKFL